MADQLYRYVVIWNSWVFAWFQNSYDTRLSPYFGNLVCYICCVNPIILRDLTQECRKNISLQLI